MFQAGFDLKGLGGGGVRHRCAEPNEVSRYGDSELGRIDRDGERHASMPTAPASATAMLAEAAAPLLSGGTGIVLPFGNVTCGLSELNVAAFADVVRAPIDQRIFSGPASPLSSTPS
jgi:hypothetical protein